MTINATGVDIHTQAYSHPHPFTCIVSQIHTYRLTQTFTFMHIHFHTCFHTHTHTYTLSYKYTLLH